MVMTPEERRRRMHKALGQEGSSRRERARRPESAENTKRSTSLDIPEFKDAVKEEEAAERFDAPEEGRRRARRPHSVESGFGYDERQARSEWPAGSADRQARDEWPAGSAERRARSERQERSDRPEPDEPDERPAEVERHARGGRPSRDPERGRRPRRGTEEQGGGIDPVRIALLIGALLVIVLLVFCLKTVFGAFGGRKPVEETTIAEETSAPESETEPVETEPARDYIGEASLMAAQYDYDGAIELLKSMPGYETNEEAKQLVTKCEETKSTLVEINLQEVTHVFFHILCVDPVNSFDSSKWGNQAGGYNSLMTTIDEFNKMMQEMYDKGFVLVSMHDMCKFTTNSDGTVTAEKQKIMLPPGKKAFVMSEDDVCYYEYMTGAGYADKMIIGEDGRPTLHYTDKDGNESVGDYDLVGCLDTFIDQHPDFSYKGHKACIVFTGYNGILGYRTDESYDPNSEYYDPKLEQGHDVQAERKEAVEVLKALVADGYDVGSHSWGHRDLGQIEFARFTKDCDRWERNVASLIREATGEQPDIIIYPKGADVADWHGYKHSNERFDYMFKLGFRYFCNVDSSQYWVQIGDDYFRQGRRALDGYNMWNDIANGYHRLGDLFDDVSSIFDPARPTPVPAY